MVRIESGHRTDHLMRPASRPVVVVAAAIIAAAFCPEPAQAYVGPGAGFAVVGSVGVILVAFLLAFASLVSWPFRAARRALRGRRLRGKASVRRAIVLGLDGLDPVLATRFMGEGKLPHFKKLAEQGSFLPLETSCPSMSPVAWSTFATGVDASRHAIFDFLGRDERTYLPVLSSTRITNPRRSFRLGRYRVPLGKPSIRLMRKSRAFWSVLDDALVPCHVLRVPITFPPERLRNGVMLSAMCAPDLRGSQGSFTFFTTDAEKAGKHTGGEVLLVERHGDVVVGELPGPANPFTDAHEELTVPFVARVDAADRRVWLDFGGNELWLEQGEYSDWITLTFQPGLGVKVKGIVRLLVTSVSPHFELYVTPINIDPESPAMPVSEPGMFAQYLAKLLGKYATLGLAEDTWALNEGVIDDGAFLEQTYLIHDERERMFLNSLRKNRGGLTVVVFDATDRVQHTFFRVLDPSHPANRGRPATAHAGAIEDLYVRMDKLLARVLEEVDEKTLLMVISDHGFKPFRRGVNLNRWFIENGYMAAKGGAVGEYLAGVDWARTRAYQLGLTGIYLNRKGREAQGVVAKDEVAALKRELKEKLTGLKDPETGETAITAVYDVAEMMSGPYAAGAPDLVIGYNVGYRASWDAAVGKSADAVLEDNTKPWSGDHCIDYRLAPGVLFCNRKVRAAKPRLMDIGPSLLEAFGVPAPGYMQGRSVFREDGGTGEGGR